MKKFLKIFGILVLLIFAALIAWFFTNMKDRHPGYNANLNIVNKTSLDLSAGFAAVAITPEVPDRWVDNNNNA